MPISNILILPDGCLENQEFVFQCKDPEDARFYSVSLDKRMQETDVIDKVEAFPNDEAVIIDNITNNKRDFKCRISGGKLNTKIGIRFKVTTQADEIHSFVCTLSIMQQGKLTQEGGSNVILGTTGPKGDKGDKGDTGPQGQQGDPGEKGDRGPQGLKGSPGDIGPAGPQGPQGIKGDTGERGPQGIQGLKGDKGDTGPQGIQGIQGLKGDIGPKGETGPKGLQGPAGQAGPKGEQGLQGIQGLKGDKGDKGDTGPQGIQGPQGLSYVNDGTADLNIHSLKSDGGNISSNGSGNLNVGGNLTALTGIITYNNFLVKPNKINSDGSTSNSSLVFYNGTGTNEQSITLVALKTGDFSIGDWVRKRVFTTIFDYHVTVNGNLSIQGISTLFTLNVNDQLSVNGNLNVQGLSTFSNKINVNGPITGNAIELNNGPIAAYIDLHAPDPNKNPDYDFRIICSSAESNATTTIGTGTAEFTGKNVFFNCNTTARKTLKVEGAFILASLTYATLPKANVVTGTQYFCTDAYSTLNPQKTKGIIVVWNGSKWVDALGNDIATL